MKKILAFTLCLVLVLSSLAACGSQNTDNSTADSDEVITLDMISCLGETHKIFRVCEYYAEKVNEISGGKMVINLLGGDEVMAEDEQLSALKNGVFDLMWDLETLSQICPLYPAMSCTGMTSKEELDAGLYDLYREAYEEEGGVYWLGKASQPQWWVLASNTPVHNMSEIAGLKIRCNSATSAVVEGLGGVPTIIPYGEIYEAMERKIVDGFIMTPEDWVQNSWQDVTSYFSDLRILEGGMTGALCNIDVWNGLTEEQQGWLTAPFEEYVQEMYDLCYENQSSGEEEMVAAGVEKIEWSQEDKDAAHAVIIESQWNSLKDKITPKYAERFAEICGLEY